MNRITVVEFGVCLVSIVIGANSLLSSSFLATVLQNRESISRDAFQIILVCFIGCSTAVAVGFLQRGAFLRNVSLLSLAMSVPEILSFSGVNYARYYGVSKYFMPKRSEAEVAAEFTVLVACVLLLEFARRSNRFETFPRTDLDSHNLITLRHRQLLMFGGFSGLIAISLVVMGEVAINFVGNYGICSFPISHILFLGVGILLIIILFVYRLLRLGE